MGTRERPETSVSSSYRADEVGGQEARQGCVAEQVSLVLGPFAIRGAHNNSVRRDDRGELYVGPGPRA